MKFDYKERLDKREKLADEQEKLLGIFIDSIKQPFREWYQEVDKSKVDWLIPQFLVDCGYSCSKQEDCCLYFIIPTGREDIGLKTVTLIVKQYSLRFVIGEQIRELTLETLRGDVNE